MSVADPAHHRDLFQRALLCHQAGETGRAEAYCRAALGHDPQFQDALQLLGVLRSTVGAHGEAVALLSRSLGLGATCGGHANMGLALEKAARPWDAALSYLRAFRSAPESHALYRAFAGAVAAWARREEGAEPDLLSVLEAEAAHPCRTLSFVVCSITPAKHRALEANLRARLAGVPFEFIVIDDARGMAEAYNRAIPRVGGDIVVFCHDDIQVHAPGFHRKLVDGLARHDILGVLGTRRLTGANMGLAGWPHLHGQMIHPSPDGDGCTVLLHNVTAPVAGGMQAMDGVFLAVNRGVLDTLRFDADTCRGFHFYDLDFTFRAHRDGLRLCVRSDLAVEHQSRGRFDEVWRQAAQAFHDRHHASFAPPVAAPQPLPVQTFGDRAQALRFVDRLVRAVEAVP